MPWITIHLQPADVGTVHVNRSSHAGDAYIALHFGERCVLALAGDNATAAANARTLAAQLTAAADTLEARLAADPVRMSADPTAPSVEPR